MRVKPDRRTLLVTGASGHDVWMAGKGVKIGGHALDCRAGKIRSLRSTGLCHTLSYMAAVTIRLDPDLQRQLDRLSRELGQTRSEVIRDALRRQLSLLRFEGARRRLMPLAEARGYLTDEDVFRDIS